MFERGGRCVDCPLSVGRVSRVVLTLIRGMCLNLCPLQISRAIRIRNTSSS